MILVSGEIEVQPGKREAAIELAREMMSESAKEPGCITYRFYSDIEDENRFRVFEEWASDEALEAHFKSPHMARFQKRIGEVMARKPEITRYYIEGHGLLD